MLAPKTLLTPGTRFYVDHNHNDDNLTWDVKHRDSLVLSWVVHIMASKAGLPFQQKKQQKLKKKG